MVNNDVKLLDITDLSKLALGVVEWESFKFKGNRKGPYKDRFVGPFLVALMSFLDLNQSHSMTKVPQRASH